MRLPFIVLFAALVAAPSFAQETIVFSDEVRPTAAEQIRFARTLARHIPTASDRRHATLRAAAAFRVVKRQWPNDVNAVFEAELLRADVLLDERLAKNAIETLEPLLPMVRNTDNEPHIQRRLGLAYTT